MAFLHILATKIILEIIFGGHNQMTGLPDSFHNSPLHLFIFHIEIVQMSSFGNPEDSGLIWPTEPLNVTSDSITIE